MKEYDHNLGYVVVGQLHLQIQHIYLIFHECLDDVDVMIDVEEMIQDRTVVVAAAAVGTVVVGIVGVGNLDIVVVVVDLVDNHIVVLIFVLVVPVVVHLHKVIVVLYLCSDVVVVVVADCVKEVQEDFWIVERVVQ